MNYTMERHNSSNCYKFSSTKYARKKHFQDSKGRRIERIANETQLKQYLQGSWAEKSLGIAIEPALRINHVTHAWDLLFERNKCRAHRTLGKYFKEINEIVH